MRPFVPWLVWSLGAALFCYGFFQRVAPSVMVDSLMRDFMVGGVILGNLSAFYFYAYAGLQVPVGLLVDAWGPRRMLTFGALLCASGSLLFGLSESLGLAYLGRLMVGAGAAFSFVGTLKIATNWFPPERFALLTGMTMMVGLLGGVGGQAPLASVVEAAGWRATMVVGAVLGGFLSLAIWLVVRDHHPERVHQQRSHGEFAGAQSLGLLQGIALVLRLPQLWLVALLGSAMSAPMLAFAGLWGVAWLMQAHDMARAEAAVHTSLLLIGWAIGSPLVGWLSDKLQRRRLLAQSGGLLGLIGFCALVYLPGVPAPLFALLFLVTGIGLGSMAVLFAMAREIVPAEVTGAAYGFLNGMVVGAGAVFQPLVGFLLDLNWTGELVAGARVYSASGYHIAFSVFVAFLVATLIGSLLLRETGKGTAR